MRYEHWVHINDAPRSANGAITHTQLWQALVVRARDPRQFMPVLVSAWVDEQNTHTEGHVSMNRRLDFGTFVVEDTATLLAPDTLVIQTRGGPTWPDSCLTISIKDHGPGAVNHGAGALHLQFVYELDEAVVSGALDAMTDTFRRKAYEAADWDMVAQIRQLAGRGVLGQ